VIIPENIRTIHINNLLSLGFRSKNNPRKRKEIDNVIISLLLNLGTKSGVPKIKVPNHEKTIPVDTPLILIFLLLCGMAEKIKVITIVNKNTIVRSSIKEKVCDEVMYVYLLIKVLIIKFQVPIFLQHCEWVV